LDHNTMFEQPYNPFQPGMLVRRVKKLDDGSMLVSPLYEVVESRAHTVMLRPLETNIVHESLDTIAAPQWSVRLECDFRDVAIDRFTTPNLFKVLFE